MQEVFELVVELGLERRRARRQLGPLLYRMGPRRWPWLVALPVALGLAVIDVPGGWLGLALKLVAGALLVAGLLWHMLRLEHGIGAEGHLLAGTFLPWSELVGYRLLPRGVVECRTRTETPQFRVTADFVEPLRKDLLRSRAAALRLTGTRADIADVLLAQRQSPCRATTASDRRMLFATRNT